MTKPSEEEKEKRENRLERWIPNYLKQFVNPYHDEFCFTRIYHHRLVAALMMEGFLPIATEGVILPKLHHERCVISLPQALHVSKSTRKKSKKFRLTVNQSFDRVVDECRKQHGPNCWLYPELVRVFKEIKDAGQVDSLVDPYSSSTSSRKIAPVRLYSIEVWNDESGALVAGELGYTVGSIFTSLTGFSAQDSAGSVQLASLGRLLGKMGFQLWDLGMDMEYKQGLGSHLMKRKEFISFVLRTRVADGNIVLPTTDANGFNCKSLVDQTLSAESLSAGGEQTKPPSVEHRRTGSDRQQRKKTTPMGVRHDHAISNSPTSSPQPSKKKRTSFLNEQKVVVR